MTAALGRLAEIPARHRLAIARLLVEPLIDDRDPARIVRTRADRRRAVDHSDRGPVPAQLAVVAPRRRAARAGRAAAARPHGGGHRRARRSASRRSCRGVGCADVHAGRRLASARSSCGCTTRRCIRPGGWPRSRRSDSQCEDFLLDLSEVDPAHLVELRASPRDLRHASVAPGARAMDARRASRGSGRRVRGARSRGSRRRGGAASRLRRSRATTKPVRAMAASALERLDGLERCRRASRRHLDDAWPVAVRAAQSLRSMGSAGMLELQARASRSDLAGRARAADAVAGGRSMLTETATSALVAFSVAVIVYFALWNASQMAMSPIALLFLGASPGAAPATRPRAGRAPRVAAARVRDRAVVQRGTHDRRECPRAAGAGLRDARNHRRQRRVVRRHAGRAAARRFSSCPRRRRSPSR